MSIVIHNTLSSCKQLQETWKSRVLALPQNEMFNLQSKRGLRRMRLAVINLMPNKEETELQWLNLFAQCSQWVEIKWFHTASRQTIHCDAAYLSAHYESVSALKVEDFHAILITGAPVEHLAFEAVDYWEEVKTVFEEAASQQIPVLGVCWAAQAMMYHHHGIPKNELVQKCFGVFEHEVKNSEVFSNLGRVISLPQSRHTQWNEADILRNEKMEVLIASEQSGIFVVRDDENRWYFSGHLEYGKTTLVKEYERDMGRGLPIHVPKGYALHDGKLTQQAKPWEKDAVNIVESWLNAVNTLAGKDVLTCEWV